MLSGERQAGFTLIELMIGMLVGLIVLSAVVYAFLATLRSSANILNSTRLNSEISVVTDLITGQLRRTGYWPVSGAGASPYGSSIQDLRVSNDCIVYSYYNDAVSPAGISFHGIATEVGGGALLQQSSTSDSLSCTDRSSWNTVTDPNAISLSKFSVSAALSNYCTVITGAVSGATCFPDGSGNTILARKLVIEIEAVSPNDSSWRARTELQVSLPNNISDVEY